MKKMSAILIIMLMFCSTGFANTGKDTKKPTEQNTAGLIAAVVMIAVVFAIYEYNLEKKEEKVLQIKLKNKEIEGFQIKKSGKKEYVISIKKVGKDLERLPDPFKGTEEELKEYLIKKYSVKA